MATSFAKPINNVATTVAAPYTAGSGSLVVASAAGVALTAGQWVRVCTFRAGTPLSILRATALSGTTFTITGAIEGTTDVALLAGDAAELRVTAGAFSDLQGAVNAIEAASAGYAADAAVVHKAGAETIAGVKTFTGTPVFDGSMDVWTTNGFARGMRLQGSSAIELATFDTVKFGIAAVGGYLYVFRTSTETATGDSVHTLLSIDPADAVNFGGGAKVSADGKYHGDGSALSGITEAQVANLTADLAAKAADSAVVHVAGAETVGGVKTFAANLIGTPDNFAIGSGGVAATGMHALALGYAGLAAGGNSLAIGVNATATSSASEAIAIGNNAGANGPGGVAIGNSASCQHHAAVAIGSGSTMAANELAFGTQDLSTPSAFRLGGYSTTSYHSLATLATAFVDPTDATYRARVTLNANDHGAPVSGREGLRVEADGTQARLGFFGAAAVAQPAGDIATGLVALGLFSSATGGSGGGSGTVTTVSVATANGFAGTVAAATTAPAITITTTVTGLLKGNGTAISAATAGTDYLTPSGNGSALTGITGAQVGGTVAIANGGTGQATAIAAFNALCPTTTLGDLPVRDTSGNVRVAGNTAATKKYLTQTGTGSVSALPAWGTIAAADLPTAGLQVNSHYGTVTGDTDGATITFDCGATDWHQVTLGGNRTLALTGDVDGQQFSVILKQDATGSRTVTWWSGILWPGGTAPTLTTTANKRDVFTFKRLSSGVYLGFVAGLAL